MKKIFLVLTIIAFALPAIAQDFSGAFDELDGNKQSKSTNQTFKKVTVNQSAKTAKEQLNVVKMPKPLPSGILNINDIIAKPSSSHSPVNEDTDDKPQYVKVTYKEILAPSASNGTFALKNNGKWKIAYTKYLFERREAHGYPKNWQNNSEEISAQEVMLKTAERKAYEVCNSNYIHYQSTSNSIIVYPIVENYRQNTRFLKHTRFGIRVGTTNNYRYYYADLFGITHSGDIVCYYQETK